MQVLKTCDRKGRAESVAATSTTINLPLSGKPIALKQDTVQNSKVIIIDQLLKGIKNGI